jgi:hypothetical protein
MYQQKTYRILYIKEDFYILNATTSVINTLKIKKLFERGR